MSHKKTVVVLGNEDALSEALITILLGQDLSKLKRTMVLKKYPKYENDKYEVIYTPDVKKASKDLKDLYATQHTDMSLLVIGDGFSKDKVGTQIEKLKETIGKCTEEFTVVLPLGYKCTDYTWKDEYPFKSCTLDEVFRKLAQENYPTERTKRDDQNPGSRSTSTTPMEMTGGRDSKECVTEPMKCLERKLTDTKVNLVLLGMSGTGKSASGNTILRNKLFVSKPSSKAVTTECQEADTMIDGRHVRIIDTPDIFDDEIKKSVKKDHVRKCKELCQKERCVYLLVIHVSRFTDNERNILEKLRTAFGERAHDQTVILFTRGGDLRQGDMSFEEFLDSCQPKLKEVVKACGNRCVLFENKDSGTDQVEKLMQKVMEVMQKKKMTGENWV